MTDTSIESSKHFSKSELACKCCGDAQMDEDFMDRLELLRMAYDRPMKVSSAYRCPGHNAEVSKTGNAGPHTTGRAIDIAIMGREVYDLFKMATVEGFTGVGIKQKGSHENRFIHLDDLPPIKGRPRPWIWSY